MAEWVDTGKWSLVRFRFRIRRWGYSRHTEAPPCQAEPPLGRRPDGARYSLRGSTVRTRRTKSLSSAMYVRRNSSVDCTVTSPSSVISPGVKWM